MFSFVDRIAIDVNQAVLIDMTIPTLGLINVNVEMVIAQPDPN